MQIEKNPEEDLNSFFEKVKKGYEWLDAFYQMMNPETPENDSQKSENNQDESVNTEGVNKVEQNFFVIITNSNNEVVNSQFPFKMLSTGKCTTLEKKMFSRVFEYSKETSNYIIKNKYRNGNGFYSLASELFAFRMIYTKKITTPQNVFDILEYQTCNNENDFQEVCWNFWINFVTSFLYMTCFAVLVLLACLDRLRKEYIVGKALKSITPVIDVTKFVKMDDLFNLLETYDDYNNLYEKILTPEFFASHKDKIVNCVELLGIIEENICFFFHPNIHKRINSSYIYFILCISFTHEHFNTTSGDLSRETPSHIASVKVNIDRYLDEIIGYTMDRFKTFTHYSDIRDSFFYHWRTLLGYAIPQKNHMINEMFDEKFHTRLMTLLKKFQGEFEKFHESTRGKNTKEIKVWGEKIKNNVLWCKNLGLLALNIPCNTQNRYTQTQLISKVEEIEKEFAEIQNNHKFLA